MAAKDSFKSGLNNIGSAFKRGVDKTEALAKSTKLKIDIAGLERQIAKVKSDFGKEVYDAMIASDKQATERLFTATRTRVRELEAEIAAKQASVKNHDDSAPSPAPPRGQQASGTWGAPPPSPPPGAPALPPGWKRATSPDGREYYYHEISGETSWTVPMA